MAGKKTLNIKGTDTKEYDLDEIEQDSRLNSDRALVVHVVENDPVDPAIGQIWMLKKK